MKGKQWLQASMLLLGVVFGTHLEAKAVDGEAPPMGPTEMYFKCECDCVIQGPGDKPTTDPVQVPIGNSKECKGLENGRCEINGMRGKLKGCEWILTDQPTASLSTMNRASSSSSAGKGKW